ncbi:MAG: hypothetical protein OXB93_05260 [Cytophagales bacterium]|nr:hypothetical protein [Cytophagales bacterium]
MKFENGFYQQRIIALIGFSLSLYLILGIARIAFPERQCQRVEYQIKPDSLKFLSKTALQDALQTHLLRPLKGTSMNKINTHGLEKALETHPFIESCEIYKSLNGVIKIEVDQEKPIARIIDNNGNGKYISQTGKIIPLSPTYTAYTTLIRKKAKAKQKQNDTDTYLAQGELFELLRYIAYSDFWKDQIAEIEVVENQVLMYPQVTRQRILLGNPKQWKNKLRKLLLFYQKVLPIRGWNEYREIDLRFKNQVIGRR